MWFRPEKRLINLLELLYPTKCPLCGLLAESSPCAACYGEFIPSDPRTTTGNERSILSYRYTLYRYEGRAGQAVRALKYDRSTSLAPAMAKEIAAAISGLSWDVDAVVPVPIHWSRRCVRGFNQSELICREVAAQPDLLRRTRRTQPQVGLSREERERNLTGAFQASPAAAGKRILLVDDVLTSGHTAQECAKALRTAGATEVAILAYCGDA